MCIAHYIMERKGNSERRERSSTHNVELYTCIYMYMYVQYNKIKTTVQVIHVYQL